MANQKLSAITASGANLVAADTLVGINSGTTDLLFSGTQIKAFTSASPTITGHATIEGVTATGATGTGKFVFDGTPTLVTPVLGVATGTSLALNGTTIGSNSISLKGTVEIDGSSSGAITIQTQAAAGTYNLNLPTGAGNSGDVLTSGGGGSTAMSWVTPIAINNLTDTWNNIATTFTAVKMNVTDTNSASASLLLDLEVGSSSKFSVRKDGLTTIAGAISVTGHTTFEGVTSTGATGTGKLVYDGTPTLVTPVLGVATGTSIALGGATLGSNALAITGTAFISGAFTHGVQQTTQGSIVLANTAAGAFATTIKSSNSATAAVTYTLPTAVGAAGTVLTDAAGNGILSWAAGGGGLTVGTSTITSGTNTRILYDNSGVVGEYTLSGSGTVVAMQTSPALITPALGVATGTSLALNGATIGSTFLAVTGSDNNYTASIGGGNTTGSGTHGVGLNITGTLNTSGIVVGGGFFMNVTNTASDAASSLMEVQNSTTRVFAVLNDKVIVKGLKCSGNLACRASDDSVIWQGTTAEFQVSKNTGFALAIGFGNAGYSSCDTILQRRTTATLNLGLADVNTAPVAQTITVQRPLAGGTSDVNGADFTIVSGLNKGSGTPGKIIFQSSIAGSTGTVIATPAAAITIANSSATGIAFNGYGAGAMSTDASGNITATSDENVKDIQGAFTSGLAELMQIKPIRYKWKPSSGMETEHEYAGFGARNVNSIIPLATGQNRDGSLTLQDRALLAACVNAIKELAARV